MMAIASSAEQVKTSITEKLLGVNTIKEEKTLM
jgi:hypothetical protein